MRHLIYLNFHYLLHLITNYDIEGWEVDGIYVGPWCLVDLSGCRVVDMCPDWLQLHQPDCPRPSHFSQVPVLSQATSLTPHTSHLTPHTSHQT